jgi:uncharacterized protein (DUF2236 family)
MVTVYGARSLAEGMIAGVNRAHDAVAGVTPEGEPYRATEPVLLDWVQATAAFGFLQAYRSFVREVPRAARNLFYAEGEPAARLYGATGAPTSEVELDALFDRLAPRLGPSPVIHEFLGIMRTAPILPPGARLLQPALLRAAISLLPAPLRDRLGLGGGLRLGERRLLRGLAALADQLRVDTSPAALACVRLGLPPDYLHGRSWRDPSVRPSASPRAPSDNREAP